MGAILKVRDDEGNIIEIPALKGDPGKGDMESAVYDPQGKKQDVFAYVDDAIGNIPAPDVSGQINAHNSSTSAHADIRTALSSAAGAASAAQTAANNAASAASALARFQSGLGNEYVWAKQELFFTYSTATHSSASSETVLFNSNSSTTTMRISDTLEDALNGVFVEKAVAAADRNTLRGKYVRTVNVSHPSTQPTAYAWIFYINANASWTLWSSNYAYAFDKGTRYFDVKSNLGPVLEYVNSPDPNAYPIYDGYTYTALGQLGNKAWIATGSYTGTGTSGSGNPNSLTFDFEPKIVMLTAMVSTSGARYTLFGNAGTRQGVFAIYPSLLTSDFVAGYGFVVEDSYDQDTFAKKVGTTISWYHKNNAGRQGNLSGWTYHYMAIG